MCSSSCWALSVSVPSYYYRYKPVSAAPFSLIRYFCIMALDEYSTTQQNQKLPNDILILMMGILSLVFMCSGFGFVLGIIGIVLGGKARKLYKSAMPGSYSAESYKHVKVGYNLSIVGLILGILSFVLFVLYILFLIGLLSFGALMEA